MINIRPLFIRKEIIKYFTLEGPDLSRNIPIYLLYFRIDGKIKEILGL